MKCDKILVCMSSLLRYFDVSVKSFVNRVVNKLPSKKQILSDTFRHNQILMKTRGALNIFLIM